MRRRIPRVCVWRVWRVGWLQADYKEAPERSCHQLFTIRVEDAPPKDAAPLPVVRKFEINVPPLSKDPATDEYYDPRGMHHSKRAARGLLSCLLCFQH